MLIGAGLRIGLVNRSSGLQVDEALYSTFARHITVTHDYLLIGVNNLDKPPLALWAISGSFDLFGVSTFAARLPNIAASLIGLCLLNVLARRLYLDRRVAWLAVLIVAVSPFDRGLAATAFTDPPMTMLVLAACVAAVSRRPLMAGVLIGAAFAVKESALQWLPLVIGLNVIVEASGSRPWQAIARRAVLIIAAFAIAVIPLVLWSIARDTTPDFWTLNAHNNTPGRFASFDEWAPRLIVWLGGLSTAFAIPMLGWLGIPLYGIFRGRLYFRSRAFPIDGWLTLYTLASVGLLWLVMFNTYDRYLHTLIPLLAILYARALLAIGDRFRIRPALIALGSVTAALLLTPVVPIGSSPPTVAGIDRAAPSLLALPAGSVIYENGLSWELGFYLGETPPVQVVWEATVEALIAAVNRQPGYWLASRTTFNIWAPILIAGGLQLQPIPLPGAPDLVLSRLTVGS